MLEPLRQLALDATKLMQLRAELFGVELQAESARIERLVLLLLLAGISLTIAILFSGAFLMLLFSESHRLIVSALLSGGAIVATIASVVALRRESVRTQAPFADTCRAIKLDLGIQASGDE